MLTETQLSQLDVRISQLRADIAMNEEKKVQRALLEERKDQLEDLRLTIMSTQDDYKESIRFCVKYQNDKRLKDFESIREAMKTASLLVRTKSSPQIELYTPKDRIRPETLVMVIKNGRRFPLELREGTGIGEGVSFMTSLSALQSTQFAKVFVSDEFFSSVSPSNTQTISRNLNPLTDNKFQLILIEQKNEIVEYANYREFKIVNNGVSSSVVTIDHFSEDNVELISADNSSTEDFSLESGLELEE